MSYLSVVDFPPATEPGSCEVLTHNQSLPLETLHQHAAQVFTAERLEFIMNSIINEVERGTSGCPSITARLAEELYFDEGSRLAAAEEWSVMTYQQLDHECRVRGLLDPGNHYRSRFRLEVLLRADNSQRELAASEFYQSILYRQPSVDSGYASGSESPSQSGTDETTESESSSDESCTDNKEYGHLVRCWRPEQGGFVTYRY